MDNKTLADFIRTELSKVTSAINRLVLKMDTPREQNKTTISPQHTPEQESNTTEGKMPTSAEVKPAPNNADQPERPWYKTMGGWKTLLECIAIPCAIGYAFITYFQWRDLNDHFRVEQRSWIRIQFNFPDDLTQIPQPFYVPIRVINDGKSAALRTVVDTVIELVDSTKRPTFNMNPVHHQTIVPMLFPTNIDASPAYLYDAGKTRSLTPTEIDDLITGKSYIAVFGNVLYTISSGSTGPVTVHGARTVRSRGS
jgi:hypothetical protein